MSKDSFQNVPKMAQESFHMAQDVPWTLPGASHDAKNIENLWFFNYFRKTSSSRRVALREPPEASKMVQKDQKRLRRGPKGVSRGPFDGPRALEELPKRPSRALLGSKTDGSRRTSFLLKSYKNHRFFNDFRLSRSVSSSLQAQVPPQIPSEM